jgi:hypothetical protein
MKFISAIMIALMATAANAAPFPTTAATAQGVPRSTVRYHLFVAYSTGSGTTTPFQFGPFRTANACSNAAALLASKVAIAASACVKNQ